MEYWPRGQSGKAKQCKQTRERRGKMKHFKEAFFLFSSNVQEIFLQALIISNHLSPKHWNNKFRSASVAGLVELW